MNYPTSSWSPISSLTKKQWRIICGWCWRPWNLSLFPVSTLHVSSSMHLKCLLHSRPLFCAKNAAKKMTFWSTSKLRTLNSIFTLECRFLWKAQFILKSWVDNLKVIYSWLIFRDQKKSNTRVFPRFIEHYFD